MEEKPKVQISETPSKTTMITDAKKKIAARRGTMLPPKKAKIQPPSTYKRVYRWWQKPSIKYA